MNARSALPILALTAATALTPRPATAGPWGLVRGEWYSRIESSVLSTRTIYLDSGVPANNGVVLEQREASLYTELGWKNGMTAFFRLPIQSVTAHDEPLTVERTDTGFQDLLLGMRFQALKGRLPASFEVSWDGPLGYNRKLSLLGDGLQQLSVEGHLGASLFGRGFIQASAGRSFRYLGLRGLSRAFYHYVGLPMPTRVIDPAGPGSERWIWSDLYSTSADLAMWVSPSLLVGGGYRGSSTLAAGPLGDEGKVHLAGPILLYRVDDRLDMVAGSWTTTGGRNASKGTQVYVGMALRKTKLNRLQGFLGGTQAP